MKRLVPVAIAAALIASAPAARAGGIIIPGYGSQAQPRAGAFTAKADDPTALFHNPAGMAKQSGTAVSISFNLLHFSQTFQRAGAYEDLPDRDEPYEGQPYPEVSDNSNPIGLGTTAAIPLIAATSDLGLGLPLRFGAGVLAANGYPFRDYEGDYVFEQPGVAPPPQRYDVIRQDVIAAFPTVGAAYAISDKLMIGATFKWGIGNVEAKKHVWALRNYEEDVTKDGEVTFKASDYFIPGYGIGILWAPTSYFELGANYKSFEHVRAKGTLQATLGDGLGLPPGIPNVVEPVPDANAKCEPGGTVAALKGCLNLDLPRVGAVGGRFIMRDGVREVADLEFDVQWENWSRGSDVSLVADAQAPGGRPLEKVISRHGFSDTFSFRLGGAYNLPVGANLLSLRAGAAYDTAATENGFTRLDLDGFARTTLGAGVGFQTGRYRIDLGVGTVLEGDRTVPADCNPTVDNPGCDGSGTDTPVKDRDAPDPEQPLEGPGNQLQSPYNGGDYSQGYLQASLGLTASF